MNDYGNALRSLEDGPVPLHEQIAARLRELIVAGEWPPHYKLAAEPGLAEKFGVSRGTVRRALKSLIDRGLLVQVQGKGTFVASASSIEQPIAQELLSFHEGLRLQGVPFSTETLLQAIEPASSRVAGFLELAPRTPVLHLVRRRSIRGVWALLVISYIRSDLCPGIEAQDFRIESLFEVLEVRHGHKLDWGRRTLDAQLATGEVAKELAVAEGTPLLYLEQVSYLAESTPIEYSDVWIRADKVKLSSVLKRPRLSRHATSEQSLDHVDDSIQPLDIQLAVETAGQTQS